MRSLYRLSPIPTRRALLALAFLALTFLAPLGGAHAQAPAAPTGLTAAGTNGGAVLAWNTVGGATGYNVYRLATKERVNGNPLTSASFTDSGLTNGLTYNYYVTALSVGGESAASGTASATPAGAAQPSPAAVLQINAGGGSVSPFAADADFSGGSTGSYADTITTTKVPNAAPAAVYQTSRGGTSFSYTLPVPSGSYTLRLHFAERWHGVAGRGGSPGAGQRLMNISVNGVQALTKLDVFTAAGNAADVALVENLPATASGGQIVVGFATDASSPDPNAFVCGLEVLGTPPAAPAGLAAAGGSGSASLSWSAVGGATGYNVYRSASSGTGFSKVNAGAVTSPSYTDSGLTNGTTYYYVVTALSAGGEGGSSNEASATPSATFGLRVNAGGPNYTDAANNVWSEDEGYTGGGVASVPNTTTITGTSDPTLYRTQRAGASFGYALPAPNGSYTLSLLFAEIGTDTGTARFGVTANGVSLLSGFNVYTASGGADRALIRSFPVTVTNGQLSLSFTATAGTASVAALQLLPATGGGPAADVPAPAWALDVIPADSSDADEDGPSSSESVDLASGVKENIPGPDLEVYNPVGPMLQYSRVYRSALAAKAYHSPGLSAGWVDNFDLYVTAGTGGAYLLNYPNGATEKWTAGTGGAFSPPSGAPYLVSLMGSSFVVTFKDRSTETFTPDPNAPAASRYLLTGLGNIAGNGVTINRDSTNGSRVMTVTGGGTALLTFAYSGTTLSTLTDAYGRQITYGFTGANLTTVSVIDSPSSPQWQYGYTTVVGEPFLNSVQAANPAGTGLTAQAMTAYDANGHVSQLTDDNGNSRQYGYTPTSATVTVRDKSNNLVQQWTQKFDAMNRDCGVVDSAGNATVLVYGDPGNPYEVTSATNKNNQTAYETFDAFGNPLVATNLRNIKTTLTYDSSFFGQLLQSAIDGKTPVKYTYYTGNAVVNGVTQPNGLVQTMSVPTPGTVGANSWVTATYIYTAMGNVAAISSPAPSTVPGATVTTKLNYTQDAQYDGGGNPIANGSPVYTTPEQMDEPLTVTSPLGYITHIRYNPRGQTLLVITPMGFRTDYTYNDRDQLTRVIYPPTTANPAARAYTVYNYYYYGGPLQSSVEYDESGNAGRMTTYNNGAEGEAKQQTGEAQERQYAYDGRYRPVTITNGDGKAAQNLSYDATGNVKALAYALGDATKFLQFDPNNNLLQRQDGRGTTTTYTRAHDNSRVTDLTYSDATPAVHFGANGSGYDQYDRVTQMTTTGVGTDGATYDDDDNVLTSTTQYAALPTVTLSYTYNNDGSVASVTTPRALSGGAYSYWTFAYTYDPDSRLTDILCPWTNSPSTGAYADINYTYDDDDRLVKQHTVRADTFYVYNRRNFLVEQQESNELLSSSFQNPNGSSPPTGTIANFTVNSGQTAVSGNTSYVLLADYLMQYDPVGNRTQMAITLPPFYNYTGDVANNSFPGAQPLSGTVFYAFDTKDRTTGETTFNPANGQQTMSSSAQTQYNFDLNYGFGFDPADNPTTMRGVTQTFNDDDQIAGSSPDASGNLQAWQVGGATQSSLSYDAEDRATGLGGLATTMYTGALSSAFTGDGRRAWKQTSAGRTYFLYDGLDIMCELDGGGNPISTYARGPHGLVERYISNASTEYINYLFDPNGNVVHRVRATDPALSAGAAVFAKDTALYDSFGMLHADIDTISGGFSGSAGPNVDMVGYGGEGGAYTDVETLTDPSSGQIAAGTYLAMMGPGGVYYNPASGVGMARSYSDSLNEYADNLNPLSGYSFSQYVRDVGQVGLGEAQGALDMADAAARQELNPIGTTVANGVGMANLVKQKGAAGAAKAVWGGVVQQYTDTSSLRASGHTALNWAVLAPSVMAGGAGAGALAEEEAGAESALENAGDGCLVAGTLVWMADGGLCPVERVHTGDWVLTRDPATGREGAAQAAVTTLRSAGSVVAVTLADGAGGNGGQSETVTASPEHPFFVQGRGFVPACMLAVGNAVVTRAGPPLTVTALSTLSQPGGYAVYNFVVPGDHSYFVGTLQGGAWVHNPRDCSEVLERYGNEAEALEAARTGRLSAKPGHEANPKWISEVGRITRPQNLGSPRNYTHRMEIHVTAGTKTWLQQFLDKPDEEPGRYAVPADKMDEFNARVKSISSTRFRTPGRQMRPQSR